MSKRILTFFLAVLMLVGSIVPVFAEEADVVVHEPVMANGVDLGKREMVKEDSPLDKAVAKKDVASAEEVETTETEAAKPVKVTIKFVDPSGDEIAKPMVKEYALGEEKTIKVPDIKGYIKKDDTKSFTVTEGIEVPLVYEKIKANEAVVADVKAESDELDVADVNIAEPVGAESADASLFTFDGAVLTGLSDKGKAMVDAKLAAGEEVTLTVPAKTDADQDVTKIADNAFRELGVNFAFEANDKLVSIGDHAFFKNKIASLDLSAMTALTEIKPYAFAHNELNELVLPDSLNKVGAYAFRDNLIKDLDTKNVVSLGKGAFSSNRLEKLTLRDALTTIGSHAFEQNALVEVEIGNNVTSFGTSVFAFNNRYVKINTENQLIKNEKVYRGYGHVVNPVKITVKYVDSETNKSILDDKILGDDLTDINALFNIGEENSFLPDKVKGYWIQDEVKFTPDKTDYTLTLKYVPTTKKPTVEGANVRMIALNENIGEKELLGFIKATDLTGKDITDKVTVSPKTLDTSTGGLKKVTYTVTDEFDNSSVVDIELPVAIDWNNYPIGNGWVLGDFVYSGNKVTGFSQQGKEKVKTNKKLVVPGFVPRDGVINVKDLEKVTGITAYAFNGNQLRSVVIPDSVTSIEAYAFRNNKLTLVVIPKGVTSIGYEVFPNNELTEVVIPDSVTSIDSYAFKNNHLTEVAIPDSVTSIGNGAFSGNQLTSAVIPDSVTSIGNWAFAYNQLTNVVIPDSVTSIGADAFDNNKLTNVVIGNSVTSIGDGAFAYNQLTNVVIPDSVTSISNRAFFNNQLTSVIIPDSVTSIGDGAFKNNQLTKVTIGNGVISIAGSAFSNNQLTEVIIPDSVQTIGVGAFFDNLLEKVHIGDGVIEIGDSAFQGYGYSSISSYNRKGKNPGNEIKELYMGKSVALISHNAFRNNKLTLVVIPDSVTIIGDSAFAYNKLTSVVIGNSVTIIGDSAFYSNQLKEVTIPDSVNSIGSGAFMYNQLTSVVIPDSVTSIGSWAFSHNQGMDKNHNVYLFTPDRTNPNNLKSVPGQYLINPTELKLNFIDENGLSLYKSRQGVISSGSVIDLPNILGYEANLIKETGEKIIDNKFTFVDNASSGIMERTIIYKKTDIIKADGVKLYTTLSKSTNKAPYNYYIGDEQRLNIKLNVLKDVPNIANSTIVVAFPDEVDPASVKVPAH